MQPHANGVLAPPIIVEPEPTNSTPRVTRVGGESRASPILGNVLQTHMDGVLALPPLVETDSTESTSTRFGGNTGAPPTLGNVFQPRTDGALALPIIVEYLPHDNIRLNYNP